MIDSLESTIGGSPPALHAVDVAVKATALMALAFGCHAALGRRRALARSALWNATLVGLLLLPAASLAFPRLAIVPLPAMAAARFETLAPIPDAITTNKERRPASPAPVDGFTSGRPELNQVARPSLARQVRNQAERPVLRMGLVYVIAGIYFAIATLLGAWIAASLIAVERLRGRCVPVGGAAWAVGLDRWRGRLGIDRRVSLLATDRASIPFVVGWLRPAIVLPEALVGSAHPELIDAVLLHELGHVRRGDFGWNVARMLVQVAYWPHPLAWLMGRVVGAVREQACDDLCVHGLGGPAAYRASLLEVASGLVRRPGPGMGLAMARTSNLGRRLAWIDRTRGASRCLLRWPARLAVVVAVATAAGVLGSVGLARPQAPARPADPPAAPAKKAEAEPDAIEIVVRAKDTGKPLGAASIRPLLDMEQPVLKADGEGRLRIDLARRKFRGSLSLDVWADGYVQQRFLFSQQDSRSQKIPARLTVDLLPGEQTLGGKVTDEQGRPIVGVQVKVWGYLGAMKDKHELVYMVDATTDGQGHWRCRSFRSMRFANLYLSHPDYVSDDAMHARRHGRPTPSDDPPGPGEMPMEGLRDFSDVQVMARGVEVAGEVQDEGGKPIAGAEVGWLEANGNSTFHDDLPRTSTDTRGRFRFPHVRPGKLALQVKARGHAPGLVPVDAQVGAVAAAIKLGPPRTLTGRVVDSQGKPIAGAFVSVDTWRGYRSLGVFLDTDAEGRFRWEDAPPDPVMLNASHAGFDGVFMQRVQPDDADVVLSLRRSLSISGTVRDSATGKAIEDAQVEVGSPNPGDGEIKWMRDDHASVMQGFLHATLDAERSEVYWLRVKARGYEPGDSRVFRVDEGQAEYDFKLVKAAARPEDTLSGVVLRPDGGPLEGAEVAVAYPLVGSRDRLPRVRVLDGKIAAGRGGPSVVKADAQGRFSLTREPDPAGRYYAVVVAHPDFFAEAPRAAFEADRTIRARPWGRVEGVVRLGSRPAAGAGVRSSSDRISNFDIPEVFNSGLVTADAEGRYVLDRVLPGDVRVIPGYGEGVNFKTWSNGTLVEVQAGETARADVGGKGRPVVARIVPPQGFDPKANYAVHSEFQIESDRPNIPYPPELGANERRSWVREWWASAEGHDYRRARFLLGQAKLQPDGTLRAEDVPPGEYVLNLTFSADPIRGLGGPAGRIADLTMKFVVPEVPGGQSDEPLDLGVLKPGPR